MRFEKIELEFTVIAEDSCNCDEREMRDVLLRIFLDNEIHQRLDLPGKFFAQFNKRNETIGKQVGLYEFKNVEHSIICTICLNPKEYFELYGIFYEIIKKHKGVRKGTKGMDFDNYVSCILSIKEVKEGTGRFAKERKQTRFQNTKGNMVIVSIEKCRFGQLNDQRCILPDGISFLPYGHKGLRFIEDFKDYFKDSLSLTPEKIIQFHENNLLRFEQGILQSNERMRIVNSVLF